MWAGVDPFNLITAFHTEVEGLICNFLHFYMWLFRFNFLSCEILPQQSIYVLSQK